jgi:hypothetical protein
MRRWRFPQRNRRATAIWQRCEHDQGAQILEFAASLPLLVVFVVGVFDFSGALSIKQKLTNAAREAARVAAADPANDLGSTFTSPPPGAPVSVSDAYQVVDNYLLSQKMDDCGLKNSPPTKSKTSGLTWSYTANGCANTTSSYSLTLTINRGCLDNQSIGKVRMDLVDTCITIQYPYKWRFNSVITLLVPNAKYGGVTYISAAATAFNEN